MRVALLGGTVFIGRAITEAFLADGHELLVIHRGEHEPPDFPDVTHLHADRIRLGDVAGDITAFAPDVFVDTGALSVANTEPVLAAVPAGPRLLVLSSMDVYRAYGELNSGRSSEPMPITEESPVRDERYPYRGVIPGMDDYDKLDVEERYLARRRGRAAPARCVWASRLPAPRRVHPAPRAPAGSRSRPVPATGSGRDRSSARRPAPWLPRPRRPRTTSTARSSTSARPPRGRWASGPGTSSVRRAATPNSLPSHRSRSLMTSVCSAAPSPTPRRQRGQGRAPVRLAPRRPDDHGAPIRELAPGPPTGGERPRLRR